MKQSCQLCKVFKLLQCMLVLLVFQVEAASLKLIPDRKAISEDESLQLEIISDTSTSEPDLEPLHQDFTIISKHRQESTTIINNQIETEHKWVVTVIPKRTGSITIPPIMAGNLKTESVQIVVNASKADASAKGDVFLEVTLSDDEVYIQQQVKLSVLLYRAITTSNASLTEPVITGADAIIQKVGDDKKYTKTINDKAYVVYERIYMIHPQESGVLTIEPIMFQGQYGAGNGFFINPYRDPPRTIVKRSPELNLKVNPVPAQYQSMPWLPTDSIELKETFSDQQKIIVGEPLTRTITQKATGLTAIQLPDLDMNLPGGLKAYPDKPLLNDELDSEGITGIRQDKIAIIPTLAGEFRLPEITIQYFSPTENRIKTASLKERIIQVSPAVTMNSSDQDRDTFFHENSDDQNRLLSSSDKQSELVQTEPKADLSDHSIESATRHNPVWVWQLLCAGLLFGWIVTLVYFSRKKAEPRQASSQVDVPKMLESDILKNIEHACHSQQAKLARDMILKWSGFQWPQKHMLSTDEIAELLDMVDQFRQLNASIYNTKNIDWDGSQFWHQFKSALSELNKTTELVNEGMAPFYRLQ